MDGQKNMSNKNLLILIVLIIVIVIGVRYFGQQTDTTSVIDMGIDVPEGQTINNIPTDLVTTTPVAPSGSVLPSMTDDGKYLIYYFGDGFSPNVLQIKNGSSVMFVNKSDLAMRVYASNQDLAMYREFNQSVSVGKEDVYNYTFNQTGVWPYTNYNNQLHIANILVY